MTNLARTTAGTVLRTLEARSTPDHKVAACSGRSRWDNYSGSQIRLLHLAAIRVDRSYGRKLVRA